MVYLNLQNLTWIQAKEAFKQFPVAVVPVASTEQHGSVNPLGTDALISMRIVEEATEEVGAVYTPLLPIGISPHHRQFYGTLSVPFNLFCKYLLHVCLSLKSHGINRIVVVNGHAGNNQACSNICQTLRNEHSMIAVLWTWWSATAKTGAKLFPSSPYPDHAGATETSLNLYLHESLVQMKLFKEKEYCDDPIAPGVLGGGKYSMAFTEKFGEEYGASLPLDMVDRSRMGYSGNPALGSSEKGRIIFEEAKVKLVKLLLYLKDVPYERFRPQPHMK